jgi:myosin heavy subunit
LIKQPCICSCTPHYIRCIKPNDEKKGSLFKTRMCIEQLTYAGVFEAVQIRKSGYPFRCVHVYILSSATASPPALHSLLHRRFVARYRPLTRKEHGWIQLNANPRDDKAMCRAILACVNQDFSKVQIGNTMVLYRAEEHRILELLRNLSLERVLPVAQRAARRKIGRSFRKAIRQARPVSKPCVRQSVQNYCCVLRFKHVHMCAPLTLHSECHTRCAKLRSEWATTCACSTGLSSRRPL